MVEYRFFLYCADGSVTETKSRYFRDDLSALDAAKAIEGFERLEGWQGGRLVFRMDPEGRAVQ